MVSPDTIMYHLAPTRSKAVSEAILHKFSGIMLSDSYSAWNDVGSSHQKCLLHYFRDMYRTLEKNDSEEFRQFFDALYGVLKEAIALYEKHGVRNVPEHDKNRLQEKINELAATKHTDEDCKRYAKRLRREGQSLLTFLDQDVEYHNNISERALRRFAAMRKTLYGNRSVRGIETTEILSSVYATCKLRRINPYEFCCDYLDGKIDSIPKIKMLATPNPVLAKNQLPVLA